MEQPTLFSLDVSEGRVKIIGEVDVLSAPLMIEAVVKAMTVELDLSEVTFIDSSGLFALNKLHNYRSAVRVVAVSPQVERVLEITGLAEALLTAPRVAGA